VASGPGSAWYTANTLWAPKYATRRKRRVADRRALASAERLWSLGAGLRGHVPSPLRRGRVLCSSHKL
jgi:hypothetical protein